MPLRLKVDSDSGCISETTYNAALNQAAVVLPVHRHTIKVY